MGDSCRRRARWPPANARPARLTGSAGRGMLSAANLNAIEDAGLSFIVGSSVRRSPRRARTGTNQRRSGAGAHDPAGAAAALLAVRLVRLNHHAGMVEQYLNGTFEPPHVVTGLDHGRHDRGDISSVRCARDSRPRTLASRSANVVATEGSSHPTPPGAPTTAAPGERSLRQHRPTPSAASWQPSRGPGEASPLVRSGRSARAGPVGSGVESSRVVCGRPW